MRKITKLIVHCAYTKASMDIGSKEIKSWHVDDNKWSDIGYHFVIRRDGQVELGRPFNRTGAHCKGQNRNTVGICLVGGMDDAGGAVDNFMHVQYTSLETLLLALQAVYPDATLHGHKEFANKDCPCFDVAEFVKKCGGLN